MYYCIIVIIITIFSAQGISDTDGEEKMDIIIFYTLGRYIPEGFERRKKIEKLTSRYDTQSVQSNAGKQSWSRIALLILLLLVVVVLELGLAVTDRNLQRNVPYVTEGNTQN